MKVVVLIENKTIDDKLMCEHGLSIYIEVKGVKLLFDTGQSNGFSVNAEELGIDLGSVNYGIISHGHYDHSGGLSHFLALNKIAKVYVNKNAYGDFYSQRSQDKVAYIGMDKKTLMNSNINLVDGVYEIAKGLTLVSGITGNKFFPSGNQTLLSKEAGKFVKDTFIHEQNLVVEHEDKVILFAGCAHNGILNIIDYVEETLHLKITHLFSGLHLYSHSLKKSENPYITNEIAKTIQGKQIKLWTGHCTGDEAFEQIKLILEDDLQVMTTGTVVEL